MPRTEPTCSNCRFGHREGQLPSLMCRRRAPVIIAPSALAVAYPRVAYDGWCGEHELELEAPRRSRRFWRHWPGL